MQNRNNLRLCLWKNKFIIYSNKSEPDIEKNYFHAKDPDEAKYQFLIKKCEDIGANHFNDSKYFIEYSKYMDGIYKNIEEYNPNKKRKILMI